MKRSLDEVNNTIDTTLAPLESPEFTGTPTMPTAAQGTNTTQGASTAFVQAEIAAIPSDIQVYANLTALRAETDSFSNNDIIYLEGHTTPGDLGGGHFKWDSTSTTTDDNGGVIKLTATATGRFIRILDAAVLPEMWGAVGNGTTNDTTAMQAAIDYMERKGGLLLNGKYRVTSINVKAGVALYTQRDILGLPGTRLDAPFDEVEGAILIDGANTINLYGSAGLKGVFVYPYGTTFPVVNNTGWTGTAITVQEEDVFVIGGMILGFNLAITSTSHHRGRFQNINIDCDNGIYIEGATDIPRVENVHCWPFSTIESAQAGTPGADITRTGTAFRFNNIGDWNKLVNCFSWGYLRGVHISDCTACMLIGCGADGFPSRANSKGFVIDGSSDHVHLSSCQTSVCEIGLEMNITAGYTLILDDYSCWTTDVHGILVSGGNVMVNGGFFKATPYGVTTNNANSTIMVANTRFDTSTNALYSTVPHGNFITSNIVQEGTGTLVNTNQNIVAPAVASASTLNIPKRSGMYYITGTTNITDIPDAPPDTIITLLFASTLTVSNNSRLSLPAGNFTTATNYTLTLRAAGNGWHELSRTPVSGGGGGISNVVEDITPQLGGNLDMNGFNIGGNTEAQIDSAVANTHVELHAASSHTDISSSGSTIDDAVGKRHTQGTDTSLGTMGSDINMNGNRLNNVLSVNGGSNCYLTSTGTTTVSASSSIVFQLPFGTSRWYINGNGLYPFSDNNYVIGSSTLTPSEIYSWAYYDENGVLQDTQDDLVVMSEFRPMTDINGDIVIDKKSGFEYIDLASLPPHLTNRNELRAELEDEMGGMFTDQDFEEMIIDHSDNGLAHRLFRNSGKFHDLTSGAVRQLDIEVKELFEMMANRITKLENKIKDMKDTKTKGKK